MTKSAADAMKFEKSPLWSRKTNVSYTISKEKRAKILLKDATVWDIFRHLVKKYDTQLTYLLALGVGVLIGLAI
jgi:hypothetical protein